LQKTYLAEEQSAASRRARSPGFERWQQPRSKGGSACPRSLASAPREPWKPRFDTDSSVPLEDPLKDLLSRFGKTGARLGKIEPLPQYWLPAEVRELSEERCVHFGGCRNEQAPPRLAAIGKDQYETSFEVAANAAKHRARDERRVFLETRHERRKTMPLEGS